jgi:hypothetical protein
MRCLSADDSGGGKPWKRLRRQFYFVERSSSSGRESAVHIHGLRAIFVTGREVQERFLFKSF